MVIETFSISTRAVLRHFPKLTNLHPENLCILVKIISQLQNISQLDDRVRGLSTEKVETQSLGAEAGYT